MRIIDTLSRELILPELKATHKGQVLTELAQAICTTHPELKNQEVEATLLEREKLGSTGIQDGIAIPHGKLKDLTQIVVAFGRSREGISFDAPDHRPTQLFFVLLAPENATGLHLKILARLSRLLKNAGLRERLVKAGDAEEIYQILSEADSRLQESGVVSD